MDTVAIEGWRLLSLIDFLILEDISLTGVGLWLWQGHFTVLKLVYEPMPG